MEEVWDLYNEKREKVGCLLQRGKPIPKGCYHLVVSAWNNSLYSFNDNKHDRVQQKEIMQLTSHHKDDAFAKEETHLFNLLFVNDMDLDMVVANDFYREIGNLEKAKAFSDMIGVELERSKEIFLDLFLYSHGIAVLTATGKMSLDSDSIEKMLLNFLSAFIQQEKKN